MQTLQVDYTLPSHNTLFRFMDQKSQMMTLIERKGEGVCYGLFFPFIKTLQAWEVGENTVIMKRLYSSWVTRTLRFSKYEYM